MLFKPNVAPLVFFSFCSGIQFCRYLLNSGKLFAKTKLVVFSNAIVTGLPAKLYDVTDFTNGTLPLYLFHDAVADSSDGSLA